MKYYKILPEDLCCKVFQYSEGLNVDTKKINERECSNGLHFSDAHHILEFADYGTLIADVEIPESEKIYHFDIKSKAHSIILSNIRPLWNIKTFTELVEHGADIHARDDYALRYSTMNGHLEIVKFLKSQESNRGNRK